MNLISAPEDKTGMLASELLRTVRLVVDTGIYQSRWTREQVIAYLEEHLGATASKAGGGNDWRLDLERYGVGLGQACAYKIYRSHWSKPDANSLG